MYEPVEKTPKEKNQMEANGVSQIQNSHAPTSRFVDNRYEALQMRKIRDLAKNSPQNDKLRELHHLAAANSVAQKKSNVKESVGFIDNRPEAIAQRKLREMANHSLKAKSGTRFPAISSYATIQRVVAQIPNSGSPPRWSSTAIPDRSFANREEAQEAEDDLHRRVVSMTPLPMRFGSGAPYGFPAFPQVETFSRDQVPQVQEQVRPLLPMLHTLSPQNRQFNTLEPPRAPTMYFQEQGFDQGGQPIRSSGRVRQEHPSGPAAYIDEFPRSHLFSQDENILDIEHEYDLEDQSISAVPLAEANEGMHHIEAHHNDRRHRSWEVAHASGGGLSTAPMSDLEVDEGILRTALSGRIEDRRR